MIKELMEYQTLTSGLKIFAKLASTIVKDKIKKYIEQLKVEASKTPNPYDDMLIYCLEKLIELCDCPEHDKVEQNQNL